MDTGPQVQGREIDIYMWNCDEAVAFGRRSVQVRVLRLGWNPQASGRPGRPAVQGARGASAGRRGPARAPTPPRRAARPPAPPPDRGRGAGARSWIVLLEATYRAEQHHFWFRGFRAFVAPLLAEAAAGPARPRAARLRLRHRREPRRCSSRTAARSASTSRCAASSSRASTGGAAAGTASATATCPFGDASFDLVTSFDVIYSLPTTRGRRRSARWHRVLRPGGALIVNVAAMPILRGNHSVLSLERRRYTRRDAAGAARARRAARRDA